MHAALSRFEIDLASGRVTHDADKITETHVANARKKAVPGQKYVLIKPADHQKIDAAMASTLAHEAAADAREAGWAKQVSRRVLILR
jgi:phage terminase large subunit-like protein